MIHQISSIVLLVLLPSVQLSTLQGLMERELRVGNRTETFAGRLYLSFPDYLFLSMHSPLRQIIMVKADTSVVYFPDVGKAFKSSITNPFESELAANLFQVQRGWNLTGLGYTLSEEETRKDTLLKRWVPLEEAAVGQVAVREYKGRAVGFEVFDQNGRRVVKTDYLRFFTSQGLSIPTHIASFSLIGDDTLYERITYRRLRLNQEIPDSVLYYRIPEGVKVFEE